MAVSHSNTALNAAADAVVDLIDSATSVGTLEILDSSSNVLVSFDMPDPAFGDASSGTASANSISDTTADQDGTADSFEMSDGDGNLVFSGSVTATGGGGELELDNTNINSGQTVSISSFDYTALSQ